MRVRDDRGQSMLLAPVALLIVLIVGAVTLEVASLHLQQRRLNDLANSLANDAATVGFDVPTFRNNGDIHIDKSLAVTAVDGEAIQNSSLPDASVVSLNVPAGTPDVVQVEMTYTHQYILGRSIFGATTELTATGQAELVPSSP